MKFELKEGAGSLFKNTRKETENHPDYTGSIMLSGVERWLSAWVKDGKNGKFMSLSVGKPKEQRPAPRAEAPKPDFEDDLPF